MSASLPDQILTTWQVNNRVNLVLIGAVPEEGFDAVPLASKGRDVRRQLVHMNEVRLGWLYFQTTGKRPRKADLPGLKEASRQLLQAAFTESAAGISEFLRETLERGSKIRLFGGSSVRWLGYLIAHESHHRGQIALALKQNGFRLPETVALQGLWGGWFKGK